MKARDYIVSLLESLLQDIHFNADLVHGMACFDPYVLLSLALDQFSFCFNALYDSFRLQGWVSEASLSDYRDEYFEFVEYLSIAYSGIKNAAGTIPDVLDLLTSMPALRSCFKHFHLYRLCCLCITESHKKLPAV